MKVLYQRGHSLKNKEETSKLNVNYYIIVQSMWRLWMIITSFIMRVKGTEEENSSVVHFQAHSKPCEASIKIAQPFCLSVCTKQLENC
jgi:thiamine kinase-like enzyme